MITHGNPDDGRVRCFGGPDDPLMMRYHDEEWDVPMHDDRRLFESLALYGFRAGLSWRTILHKREAFRRAFDPERIARYGAEEQQRLLADAGIVRNRLKIAATISNARLVLAVQRDHGSSDEYIWGFTGHETLRNNAAASLELLPASTAESDEMSRDLKRRGFGFVGTTICYAFMQVVGMVYDHIDPRWRSASSRCPEGDTTQTQAPDVQQRRGPAQGGTSAKLDEPD